MNTYEIEFTQQIWTKSVVEVEANNPQEAEDIFNLDDYYVKMSDVLIHDVMETEIQKVTCVYYDEDIEDDLSCN